MESIVTSLKKRQRQIIDAFVFGFNSQPERLFELEFLESDMKDEIKLGFCDKAKNRFYDFINVNLRAYQLNDVRPEANTGYLRNLIYQAYDDTMKKYEEMVQKDKELQLNNKKG